MKNVEQEGRNSMANLLLVCECARVFTTLEAAMIHRKHLGMSPVFRIVTEDEVILNENYVVDYND